MERSANIPCGNNQCSQADFRIEATTQEIKTELQTTKLSLQSLNDAHSSLDTRRQSSSSSVLSFEICAGQCGACPPGKYGTVSGSDLSSCIDCQAGKYSNSQSATSEASCLPCTSNSHSPSGSDKRWDCTCNAGFILSATDTCTICESGKYSEDTGSTWCKNCKLFTH